MGLQIDWFNQVVQITSPTTSVDAQVLHDFIEDEMATPRGITESDIIQPEGKIEDPTNPGVFSQIILVINSPWQIQFWGGSGYTRIFGGKVIGGLSDQPIKATGTAGDVTVLESPVDGLTVVSGSGVTAGDVTDITNSVWAKALEGTTSAEEMMRIMASVLWGKVSGMDTQSPVFRSIMDTKDRVTATTDEHGNRSSVSMDGT